MEADVAQAKGYISQATTEASLPVCRAEDMQEVVDPARLEEAVYKQWDESVREQWHAACPGTGPCWEQPAMVPYLLPAQAPQLAQQQVQLVPWNSQMPMAPIGAGQVFVVLQPAQQQAAPQPQPQVTFADCASVAPEGHTRSGSVHEECCALLTQGLEAGGDKRVAAVASLFGEVLRLALDGVGCRVVQRALELVDGHDGVLIARELHGHVQDLIKSPHGNYVLQKVVEVLPPTVSDFVVRELHGSAAEWARHRFGCRVLIRLMEHCPDTAADAGRAALIGELLAEVDTLCRHEFAHHVIKAILEHAHSEQQKAVYAALGAGAARKARDRYCSYVMEAALESSNIEQAQVLSNKLLGDTEANVISLSQTRFGTGILRAMLKIPGASSQRTASVIRAASPLLRNSVNGQQLLRQAAPAA